MDIRGIDHIEFYVGDADKAADYLCDTLGFSVCGRGGPETGLPDCRSVLLRQRENAIVVTAALGAGHPAAEYVRRHGDGVAVIGMRAGDASAAFAQAVGRGSAPVSEPTEFGQPGTRVVRAAVAGPADVVYRFVTRDKTDTPFLPGAIEETDPAPESPGLLRAVDHVALCVPGGRLGSSVRCYAEIFEFKETFEDRIMVGEQAMNSKVVQSTSGEVTFVILEPDTSLAPGRIDDFLTAHDGAGVQHVAFLTDNIVAATRTLVGSGLRFLPTPASYYQDLTRRLGSIGIPVDELQELNILADRDEWGMLFQIFTESRHPRRTFFWELIDRRGARTFGNDNITALYEAVEREAQLNDY